VKLSDGTEVSAYAVVIATGMAVRMLDAPGVEPLLGIGIYYGAAMTEGRDLSRPGTCALSAARIQRGRARCSFPAMPRRLTMLVRAPNLSPSMSMYLVERIRATANIKVINGVEVSCVKGQGRLEQVMVRNSADGTEQALDAAAMFHFSSAWRRVPMRSPTSCTSTTRLHRDRAGSATGRWQARRLDAGPQSFIFESSVPGVFAVGDVRSGANRRVAAAVGEGSAGIYVVHKYLETV
jgi:thioredoxin reductase (NADPH)